MKVKRSWLWIGMGLLAVAFLYLPALGIGGGQLLAFLLLLLCPLMHFFGMHRHGDHGGGNSGPPGPRPAEPPVEARDRETRQLGP